MGVYKHLQVGLHVDHRLCDSRLQSYDGLAALFAPETVQSSRSKVYVQLQEAQAPDEAPVRGVEPAHRGGHSDQTERGKNAADDAAQFRQKAPTHRPKQAV